MTNQALKTILIISLLVALPFIALAGGTTDDTPMKGRMELVVLHTNDFHGHPLKFYNFPAPDVGGLPAIATIAQDIRNKHDNVLFLDAGDLNTGRPESNFFQSAPDIIGYNYVGYDAMVLGNHEFDKPLSVLKSQQRMANFPFLSANVRYPDGSLVGQAYTIVKRGNLRIGIFGLTTTETPAVTIPTITGDLVFEDEVTVARRMVKELENKTDIIIGIGHLGLYDDSNLGSRRVMANVSGIDLFIDGHSHSKIDEAVWENGAPIVQAWQWGLQVGKAVLTINDGKVVNFEWEPIPVNLKTREKDSNGEYVYTLIGEEIPEDPYLLAALEPYADQVESKLSTVIGNAADIFNNEKVRHEETALGNLVADAMVWATENQDVDFAIQNGGGIRADMPEGKITKKKIYEILPFDNSVVTVEMTGAQVKAMFDYVSTITRGKGAFPQVSKEVSFTVDFTTGETRDIRIDGQALDVNRNYKVATNSFMAAGGDNYDMMVSGYKYDTSSFQRDVVIDYIQTIGGILRPKVEGRITVLE